MKTRKLPRLTRTQKAKLHLLYQHLIRNPNRLTRRLFERLGITARELTPAFLFHTQSKLGPPLLQILAERGYLRQIPPACLTARVVLQIRNYPDWQGYHRTSFLMFCAANWFYPELPTTYQTRQAILHSARNFCGATPLWAAARGGMLFNMPLHVLEYGDVTSTIFRESCFMQQADRIEHLMPFEHIDIWHVESCFAVNCFPKLILRWISDHLDASNALNPDSRIFEHAVIHKVISLLQPSRFSSPILDVINAVEKGKRFAQSTVEDEEWNCDAKKIADNWLIEASHLALLRRGEQLRRLRLRPY